MIEPIEVPPLLSARRAADHITPAPELVEAREAGEWPRMAFRHPQYDNKLFETIAVTRYSEVREVLGCPVAHMGVSRTDSPGSMAGQDGALLYYNGTEHSRLRKMLNRAFTVRRIEQLRPRIEETCGELLDAMEKSGGPVDLVEAFAKPFVTQVICELLGVPFADRERFEQWAPLITNQATPTDVVQQAIKEVHDYIGDLVDHYREHPGDGFISTLVTDEAGDLTHEELVGLSLQLFLAGQDATAHSIAGGVVLLLERPDQLAAVRDDETITKGAVEEIVRYLSAAAIPNNRLFVEDAVIGGREVKAGERVTVSLLAANFDPALVGDAPELDVRRKMLPHVGFGFGPHQCVGQHLARLEMGVAFVGLFRRFPGLRLDVPVPEIDWLTERASIYGLESLPVTW